MKPVQQVFGLRIQIELHVAHVLAAVGEEIDLLVGPHALALEQLKQTALGFFIVGLNPGKAPFRQLLFFFLVALKSQNALAGNHLEMSLLVPPADIATIDPDGKRTIGSRKFVPAPLAPSTKQNCSSPISCSNRSATSATCWRMMNVLTGSSIGSTSCKSFDVIP